MCADFQEVIKVAMNFRFAFAHKDKKSLQASVAQDRA